MNRRRCLQVLGTVSLGGLAGCSGSSDEPRPDTDETERDPELVIERYYADLDAGNADDANGLLHPDSDEQEMTEELIEPFAESEVSVENMRVGRQTTDDAEVTTYVTLNRSGENRLAELEGTIELRSDYQTDRKWRLYDSVLTGVPDWFWPQTEESDTESEEKPSLPEELETVITNYYRALNNGDREEVQRLAHSQGHAGEISEFQLDAYEEDSIRISELSADTITNDSATVNGVEVESPKGIDERETESVRVEARTEDGSWRVDSMLHSSEGGNSASGS